MPLECSAPRKLYDIGLQPVEPCSCTADEARELLDAIDTSTIVGLRDRALIALMTFTFARVGAAAGKMRVEDVYVQGRRTWVRLHEKGGKRHEMPCHHKLEADLHSYMEALHAAADAKGTAWTRKRGSFPRPKANRVSSPAAR
jgi:site-specific recombinase XerC